MATNLIEYEIIRVGPALEDIKKSLNNVGRKGYHLHDARMDSAGVYTFIFSRDTGRLAEGDEIHGEWIDDGFVNEETSWT